MATENQKLPGSPSDYLANERTFLAWMRTGIALMGFGFVVVKFSLFIKQLSLAVTGHPHLPVTGFSGVTGTSIVAVGALTVFLGYLRYKRIEKQLLAQNFDPQSRLVFWATAAVLVVSLLLIYYLLPNL